MAHAYYHWPMYDEAFSKCLFILEMAIKFKAEQKEIVVKKRKQNGEWWHRPISKIIEDLFSPDCFGELKNQLHRARNLRNYIAHPERHGFVGPNDLNRNIKLCVNLINKLFQDEKIYKQEIKMVREASKYLSRVACNHQLFLKKGKSGNRYLIYELLDFDLFGETMVLFIHPYPSLKILEEDNFIHSDPLKLVFSKIEFQEDRIIGLSDNGEQLDLLQVNPQDFAPFIKAYKKHLDELLETDINNTISYWNSTIPWQLVTEEYEYNKMRYN